MSDVSDTGTLERADESPVDFRAPQFVTFREPRLEPIAEVSTLRDDIYITKKDDSEKEEEESESKESPPPIPFATAEEMSAVHTALDDVREQMKEIETEFQRSTESSINREESLREYVDAGFKELHTQFNEAIKKLEQGIYDLFF